MVNIFTLLSTNWLLRVTWWNMPALRRATSVLMATLLLKWEAKTKASAK